MKKYDMHVHIWKGKEERNMEAMVKAGELYGIDKIFVSGLAGDFPDLEDVNRINDYVLKFMKRYPDYVEGLCHVNPRYDACMDTLQRCVEDGGMIGMKLWIATFCDDPLNYRFIEKCIDYDIPILLHAWRKTVGQRACESTPERVANIAKRYPEGTFIMAHIAGNCYYGVKPVLDCENVYIDFCGSVFRADDLEYAVELVGAKRILFGTDMPGSYLVSEGQVWEANISEEEKEMIMWKNTARLFYKEKVE
ncbi:MAG: amidohydrolase family protein [Clostridia bacterium]|jgi:predicted TIM-barrel fold metal-dependent hydrolase